MKIIFSRKGFDSATGGMPSPIFPSDEFCSLHMPRPDEKFHRYEGIYMGARSLGPIVSDLTRDRIKADDYAHLDPDLRYESIGRHNSWRPIFGQVGSAERHLENKKVTTGDIFLFYGWFRKISDVSGNYKYVEKAPDLHVIFGWLQINDRILVHDRTYIPPWALQHQHCIRTPRQENDSIYISTSKLTGNASLPDIAGGGVFRNFDTNLCLTASDKARSIWQLPKFFHPGGRNTALSYHGNLARWEARNNHVLLKSVGRGQEFVLDCEDYPEAIEWLANILSLAA